jgi:hypothetical protein
MQSNTVFGDRLWCKSYLLVVNFRDLVNKGSLVFHPGLQPSFISAHFDQGSPKFEFGLEVSFVLGTQADYL